MLQKRWTRRAEEQNNLITQSSKLSLQVFNDLRKVGDSILDVSTGGFLKAATGIG